MPLREVAPEPVEIPIGVPIRPKSQSYVVRTIRVLSFVQKWSVIPFTMFAGIHLLSVAIVPAFFGVEAGNDLILAGRELYQMPQVEWGLLISTSAHVISGILLNGLRKYYNYIKYGTSKSKKNHANAKYKKTDERDEVKDINQGLGGITSLLGLGPRKSLSYKWFGLSPLSFSGYIFLGLILGHVYMVRVGPLLTTGDSGIVDLNYVSKSMQRKGAIVHLPLIGLVSSGVYHMVVGWNRVLGLFTRRDRLRSYATITSIVAVAGVSMWRIHHALT